ncbi:MAG: chromate transporter [Sulfolobales archaeon]|nr:chromate transporter [Sulfolobales archaeon]MCX8185795.1 chromate transporter [Sulfolobales archaeon]MDW7970109.1 chromate transporter [Sulfolobales archaeon]
MLNALTLYLNLFIKFAKIGILGFGGGWAIIGLIEEEVVNNSKWLGSEEFSNIIAVSASLPGPIALNVAIYTGFKIGGLLGAIITASAIITPPSLVMLAVAYGLSHYLNNYYVKGFINGLKAVVIGLFTLSAYSVIRNTLTTLHTLHQTLLLLTLSALFIFLIYRLRVDIIIAAVLIGLLGILATILKLW